MDDSRVGMDGYGVHYVDMGGGLDMHVDVLCKKVKGNTIEEGGTLKAGGVLLPSLLW